jgi:AcrR family transcriptional regulator
MRKQKQDGLQAQKAKATRERILDAVVALINESGYHSASSTAIANKAGITWGAVQHHFGNKEDIMHAVLTMAREAFISALANPALKKGSLKQRSSLYIDTVWQHYKSDLYFAFSEIIMATRTKNNLPLLNEIRMNKQLTATIEIFEAHNVNANDINKVLRFVHRFFAGFALDRILDPTSPFEETHIRRIKE